MTFAQVLQGWDDQAVRYYNRLLREFAAREGCLLVDYEALMDTESNPKSYFMDDHHPNEKGARLLAQKLYEALRDRVRTDLASRPVTPQP